MRRVDFVPPVDIADDKKVVKARAQQINLMGRAVSSQHVLAVDVVAVALGAARMVLGDEQGIKVLLACDDRAQVFVDAEQRRASRARVLLVEEVCDSLSDQRQRMTLLKVNISAQITQDFRRKVGVIVSLVFVVVELDNALHWLRTQRSDERFR